MLSSRGGQVDTGAGNDVIDVRGANYAYAGSFADHLITVTSQVTGGSGDDQVFVGQGSTIPGNAVLDGGTGHDQLTIDLTGSDSTYVHLQWDFNRDGSFDRDIELFEAAVASGEAIRAYSAYLYNNYLTSWIDISNFEAIHYRGGAYDDLFFGSADLNVLSARGGSGVDTLFADWSGTAASIEWDLTVDNDSEKTLSNGVVVQSIERVYVRTGSGEDRLVLSSRGGQVDAGAGSDTLKGGYGDDTLRGGAGDDQLTGGAGDDYLEGGAGTDTAVYAGASVDYDIGLAAGGGVRVRHLGLGEGNDLLFGIEQLRFSDGIVTAPGLALALADDTGTAGDGITSNGRVQVTGLGQGAGWQFSIDGGTGWTDGSGSSFTLAESSYADGTVQIRLTDAVDLTATLGGTVTVDTTAPTVVSLGTGTSQPLGVGQTATLNLVFSSAVTGLSASDFVDSKGGSISDLASSDGGTTWTMLFTPNGDRLGPAGIQLSGAYTDVAGNAGSASGALAIGYAATATASDGYISGGNVYLDVDVSGTINGPDILKGQTGSDGSVAITLDAGEDVHDLLVSGGTDISTGQAFTGLIKAPAGSTMLTPLTTLLVDLVQSGAATSVADAQAKLGVTLGLPTGVDLTSYDPLAVVVTRAATSTAEEKAAALDVQAKTLAVANLLVTGAAALQGAAASGTPMSPEAASGAVLSALVSQIGIAATLVDLGNAGTLSTVLASAAADASVAASLDTAKQAAAVSAAASVLATANQAIASATDAAAAATTTADLFASLSTAVAVQTVVQGDLGTQLAAGQTTGLPTDRDALSTLTQQLDVSQLQLTVDQAATADTTPPPTPSLALAVDTGSNSSDGISTNGQVRVRGLEAGAVWEYSIDGGTQWSLGSGYSFTLAVGTYAAGQVRARQSDAAGNDSGVGQTAINLTMQAGVAVDLLAYSWKANTLLPGVQVQAGSLQAITGSNGAARWEAVTDSNLAISASRPVPHSEAADTAQAVNLQDAIAVLRMVVGLEVNGAGRPISPYQAFAADFNADGQVGLSDAIGMLRHVVGLDAPSPQWLLFNEADPTAAARAGLQPGTAPALGLALLGADARLGLVGVLRGDVDGSFAGPAGAPGLDQLQPAYFNDLPTDQHIAPVQFGIYG